MWRNWFIAIITGTQLHKVKQTCGRLWNAIKASKAWLKGPGFLLMGKPQEEIQQFGVTFIFNF